ncbi:hypothetical protein KMW28_24270 [Flammeovirga yaeyamensis]|uniref:Tail specific protease domain-containing protein n=1 Tax=Flammeovirga yaeyamensis TaxID=367791 RepID=A0AAX1NDD9_9BACT|nr:S41 family peptidase [Flammeovirga yaeyamensis]MBB3696501.1 hypothetical protein [Flammeovirga yaeyamensis]NMF33181.1 hypothetical protein [Flammeovirga yaeyamensis]QWG05539.1 hypothetical protein KMW28_24270 [Flammeovirga yaeyamensis]
MNKFTFFFLVLLANCLVTQAQKHPFDNFFNKTLSKNQVEEDLIILRKGLEKIHSSLYQYISKSELDALFEEASKFDGDKVQLQDFYKTISFIAASVKCQHTIATPSDHLIYKMQKKGKFFPLRIFWEFDPVRAYVIFDFSNEANLPPGAELLSINGKSIQSIYDEMLPYFPSDGHILSNKHSRFQVGVDFQFWYYLLMERPDNFLVELSNEGDGIFTKNYEAVTFKEWTKNYKKYLSQKDPTVRKYTDYYSDNEKLDRKAPIRYSYLSDSIALLKVFNFDDYDKFNTIIPEAFESFERNQVKHLIIDVKYNGGGNDILGRKLFSYLIQEPTPYFDSLYSSSGISDTTFLFTHTDKNVEWYNYTLPLVDKMNDGRFATKPSVNEGLKIQQPSKNNFKGKVYILMNGRSASTTSEFLAATHYNQLATFIGEESGGDYHGGNGGDFAKLKLPNSEILIHLPLTNYVMNSKEKRFIGRGTLPDYPIKLNIDEFLEMKDQELEEALRLIRHR